MIRGMTESSYDPQFVPTKGGWVGQPNASQGGGNSWRIGCDMPGADFGIVMIVADVAASWGQHSGSGYAPGRPQIGPGKCECHAALLTAPIRGGAG